MVRNEVYTEIDMSEEGEEVEMEEIKTDTIIREDTVYIWNSMQKQGIKSKLSDLRAYDDEEFAEQDVEISGESYNDTEQIKYDYDYKCENWRPEDAKFIVPTNIEFIDLNETMEQLQDQLNDACGSCDQLTDETAKAQCKTMLNCE